MKKIEILAPAGSPQQLEAALRSGADAVYLGMGSMNARRSAANFDGEAFEEAAAMCRERGVKLYLTLNTLVFDDEWEQARELFERACAAGADGVIVQDVGFARQMALSAPEMPLHGSTQMSVHSPAGLRLLAEAGFKRVVLSRELSLSEIKEIAENAPAELEVFVHGALCMSVSGQCYMSAVLGGRSGNRGRCAQPCRLPFRAGRMEYCLSLRDCSLLDSIGKLEEAGVRSLKIEGRMKRPEYCAAAVTACRQARDDGSVEPELRGLLSAVFSRSGFTDGYLTGKRGAAMFGRRTQDDVEAGDTAFASLHELYKNEFRRVPVDMTLTAREGENAALTVTDGERTARAEGQPPLPAKSRATTSEEAAERLAKTGGTPYLARDVRCEVGENAYLPASALNALRRDALGGLSEERRRPRSVAVNWQTVPSAQTCPHTCGEAELHAVFRSAEQIPQPERLPEALKRIYLPLETPAAELARTAEALSRRGIELAVEAQRGLFGSEERVRGLLAAAKNAGVRVCMAHNLGLLLPVREAGLETYGGFGLNLANTASMVWCEEQGLCGAEVSFELTLGRVARLGGNIPRGVCIYGLLPLMLTRNCPSSAGKGCPAGGTGENCFITDRLGRTMPVRCRGEGAGKCAEIFNTLPLSLTEKQSAIRGAEHRIARFVTEDRERAEEVLACCAEERPVGGEITRGLWFRGVE